MSRATATSRPPREAQIQWRCPACLAPNQTSAAEPPVGPWRCCQCKAEHPARPDALDDLGNLQRCPFCGCRDLYRQRDFNRKLGIGIIVLGVVIGLLSRSFLILFIMLNVVALIDFLIYRLVPEVVVCYCCQTVMRGYPGTSAIAAFDLNVSDKYLELERKRGW